MKKLEMNYEKYSYYYNNNVVYYSMA
jgi:hypothetical protein